MAAPAASGPLEAALGELSRIGSGMSPGAGTLSPGQSPAYLSAAPRSSNLPPTSTLDGEQILDGLRALALAIQRVEEKVDDLLLQNIPDPTASMTPDPKEHPVSSGRTTNFEEDTDLDRAARERHALAFATVLENEDFDQFMRNERKIAEFFGRNFCHYVDAPDNLLARIVMSPYFNLSIMGAIMANIVVMGVETQLSLDAALGNQDEIPNEVETIGRAFTFFFLGELLLRLIALRQAFFFGVEWKWNMLDCLLILISLMSDFTENVVSTNQIRILRIVRVVKAIRFMRIMQYSRSLRTMISAILASLQTLIWLFFLLTGIFTAFGIFFAQIATGYLENHENVMDRSHELSDPYSDFAVVQVGIEKYMSSVPHTIWALLFAAAGAVDWFDLAEPLARMSWIAAIVFTVLIIFVNLGVLNVIVGIFVANAADNLDPDVKTILELEQRASFVQDMKTLFQSTTGEGTVTLDSYLEKMKNPEVQSFMRQHKLDCTDSQDLFHMCDVNGDGTLNMDEFVFGCLRLTGDPRCADIVAMLRLVHLIHRDMEMRARRTKAARSRSKSVRDAKIPVSQPGSPPMSPRE